MSVVQTVQDKHLVSWDFLPMAISLSHTDQRFGPQLVNHIECNKY